MATGETIETGAQAPDPDVTLMLQVRDDVSGAFEVLIERYQDRLLAILAPLVGRADAAESLAEDVFLHIYRIRKGYRPRGRFAPWLFSIAYPLAMNHLRRGGRGTMGPAAAPRGNPVEPVEAVRAALDALEDDQRMAVLLSKFERMRYAEIAEVLGRPEPAIRSLLAHARMALRERLEPYLRAAPRGG